MRSTAILLYAAALGLGACTTLPPTGPSVMVLPGSGMTFAQFQADQAICQQFAAGAVGAITPGQAATQGAVNSAAVGTAVGAAAGALMGAASHEAAEGAAAGAGAGLLMGSAAGSGAYGASAYALQQRFDIGFIQCMYAKGHQVPVPANAYSPAPQAAPVSPPPPGAGPALPPGYYPPPPPPSQQPPPSGTS
jgi:hypothetical protein